MGLTVFDDAPIGDDFVANCTIPFEDLTENCDIWVSYHFSCYSPIDLDFVTADDQPRHWAKSLEPAISGFL